MVGRPIFFAMTIVILAFLPVFVLSGQEGKLFHPLAWTKTFAVVGATFLAVTVVPVLCVGIAANSADGGGEGFGRGCGKPGGLECE
jgi:Cu/Ag efflux pump CusA